MNMKIARANMAQLISLFKQKLKNVYISTKLEYLRHNLIGPLFLSFQKVSEISLKIIKFQKK